MLDFFGKKGSIQDGIFTVIIMFSFIFAAVIGYIIFDAFNTGVQSIDEVPTVAKKASTAVQTGYPTWLDTGFLIFWLAAFLGSLVSAWFIDINPFFFVLFLIILIIAFVALIPISNMITEMFSNASLATAVAEFPIILFFISNYYKIIVAQIMILAIILFAKTRGME